MITYTDSIDGITADKLKGFFVGWRNPPSQETHLRLLENSDEVILAMNESGKVVGFITAITDHVLSAYIPLLEVLPDYQHQGIATELVTRMFEKLKHLYMVDIVCDDALVSFYERFGFRRWTAMIYRRYSQQSGNDVDG